MRDTRPLEPFPSLTASLGALSIQFVRPYIQTDGAVPDALNERILSYLRRGVTRFAIPCEYTLPIDVKRKKAMREEVWHTQGWRNDSNTRAGNFVNMSSIERNTSLEGSIRWPSKRYIKKPAARELG